MDYLHYDEALVRALQDSREGTLTRRDDELSYIGSSQESVLMFLISASTSSSIFIIKKNIALIPSFSQDTFDECKWHHRIAIYLTDVDVEFFDSDQ